MWSRCKAPNRRNFDQWRSPRSPPVWRGQAWRWWCRGRRRLLRHGERWRWPARGWCRRTESDDSCGPSSDSSPARGNKSLPPVQTEERAGPIELYERSPCAEAVTYAQTVQPSCVASNRGRTKTTERAGNQRDGWGNRSEGGIYWSRSLTCTPAWSMRGSACGVATGLFSWRAEARTTSLV